LVVVALAFPSSFPNLFDVNGQLDGALLFRRVPSGHASLAYLYRVMLKALDDTWLDTISPHGELIFIIMGAMAEFERKLIRQRCEEDRCQQRGRRVCCFGHS
jgi:hypothetical protein